MAADVLVERRDRVAVVTVSDPDRRNALTVGDLGALADAGSTDRGHDAVIDAAVEFAAVEFAAAAAGAPRDLVIDTKHSITDTASMAEHAEAVEREVAPQVASLRSEAFAQLLEQSRSTRRDRSGR